MQTYLPEHFCIQQPHVTTLMNFMKLKSPMRTLRYPPFTRWGGGGGRLFQNLNEFILQDSAEKTRPDAIALKKSILALHLGRRSTLLFRA
jgi:hypothetical protein